tara:strand:- start:28 stop:219 length:192 start_codon:yes stop_codon:yes gene_type:complete
MKIYNVVFYRHYEITEKDISDNLFDTPEEAAEYAATELLSDDIGYFLDNVDGFMSATVDVKNV